MDPKSLILFREGDPDLFRSIVASESPRLMSYAIRLTGNRNSAEDLVQDVWVQAYRSRHSFSGTGPLLAWLITICRRQAKLLWKRDRREAEISAAVALESKTSTDISEAETASARHLKRRAMAAIDGLTEQQNKVLVSRILEGLSTRETAERLGIAEGTVKATLHQAVAKLRTLTWGLE